MFYQPVACVRFFAISRLILLVPVMMLHVLVYVNSVKRKRKSLPFLFLSLIVSFTVVWVSMILRRYSHRPVVPRQVERDNYQLSLDIKRSVFRDLPFALHVLQQFWVWFICLIWAIGLTNTSHTPTFRLGIGKMEEVCQKRIPAQIAEYASYY